MVFLSWQNMLTELLLKLVEGRRDVSVQFVLKKQHIVEPVLTCDSVFLVKSFEWLSLFLDTRFYVQDFGAFTSPQVETGGSTRTGTQMVLGFMFIF